MHGDIATIAVTPLWSLQAHQTFRRLSNCTVVIEPRRKQQATVDAVSTNSRLLRSASAHQSAVSCAGKRPSSTIVGAAAPLAVAITTTAGRRASRRCASGCLRDECVPQMRWRSPSCCCLQLAHCAASLPQDNGTTLQLIAPGGGCWVYAGRRGSYGWEAAAAASVPSARRRARSSPSLWQLVSSQPSSVRKALDSGWDAPFQKRRPDRCVSLARQRVWVPLQQPRCSQWTHDVRGSRQSGWEAVGSRGLGASRPGADRARCTHAARRTATDTGNSTYASSSAAGIRFADALQTHV